MLINNISSQNQPDLLNLGEEWVLQPSFSGLLYANDFQDDTELATPFATIMLGVLPGILC